MADRLTEDTVITCGGWSPQYARVLLIHEVDDEALVLVDGNGDGAEVESEHWLRTDDGWVGAISGGIGPFDRRPLWTWGWRGGSAYVVGCADPGQSVSVDWLGEVRSATANELGIWVCLFPEQSPPRPATGTVGAVPNNGFRPLEPHESAELRRDQPRVIPTR